MEKELIPVESKSLIEKAINWFGEIKQIIITNDQQNENAMALCKQVKTTFNHLEADRKKIVEPWNADVKSVNAVFKVITLKLKNFEDASKSGTAIYLQKQEQLRIEQQRKIDAETEERKRKAEEAAQMEADKVAKYEADGRQKLADEARARQEAKAAVAVQTVAPVLEKKKIAGVTTSKKWKVNEEKTMADMDNFKKAVQFCLDNKDYYSYLQLDLKALGKLAQATNGTMKVPGVEYYQELGVGVRT